MTGVVDRGEKIRQIARLGHPGVDGQLDIECFLDAHEDHHHIH